MVIGARINANSETNKYDYLSTLAWGQNRFSPISIAITRRTEVV